MEESNYYQVNLETGKLNIHTSKEFYDGLGTEQQKLFKHYCLWSNKQHCWISKGKAQNVGHLKSQLNQLGFIPKDTIGQKLSMQEQVEKEQQNATYREERSNALAAKANKESERLYEKAKDMASIIPMGQPILVGHHSEQRDRNYRNRIYNTYGKSFELQDKAEYFQQKAADAKLTAEGAKYRSPNYLNNKIKECDKNIRILERRLQGKLYANSPEREISDEAKVFYNSRIAEEQDRLQFFEGKMKEINPEWSRKVRNSQVKNKGNKL